MAGWAGFSDEELTRIKLLKDPLISEKPEKFKRATSTNKSRQQLQRERALQQLQSRITNEHNQAAPNLQDQQLSKPKMRPPQATEPPSPKLEPKQALQVTEKQPTETGVSHQKETNKPEPKASFTFQDSSVQELSTQQIKGVELLNIDHTLFFLSPSFHFTPHTQILIKNLWGANGVLQLSVNVRVFFYLHRRRERSRLEQLQLEQRLIEEKNKRKKALLSKTIAERSKRTMAETVKLKQIQKELQTLDVLLSSDVNILRNRIEQSSWEYYQAKKRYDKAEVEYIAAKLDLYKKTELKEQLTEHLCTIIQQNELRKANKLEELMHQLEMETDEERLELEIEVDNVLQQQEIFKGTDQTKAGDESGQQAVQKGDDLSHTVKQVEKKETSAANDTGEKDLKDKVKTQPENLNHTMSEKIQTPIATN
ncbi:RAB6-interacting golgin isoform X1 [Carcharodon carcharias]|uniref:RAB6-interacting golgin isoform X1 n=1 Tax=Carcharodon carcharias TaxID=13397 RepID=UPI001B7F1ACD|nr:RAB6-interacting golgin isoform X1 [Carcharodon carcharias]